MVDQYALVVDNSPVIRKIVAAVLEEEGWVVQTAENGLEALDYIESRRPHIIFTDLIMPKIDGEKLTFIVRNTQELKNIFLVILSGVAMEEDAYAQSMGADVCIAKGPAVHMRKHILRALELFATGVRKRGNNIEGMEGLYPREVTRELLVSNRHRDVILANMSEGVVELNHQGRVVMANQAAIRLLGQEEAQVLGSRIYHFFSEQKQHSVKQWIASLQDPADFVPLIFDYENPVRINEYQVMGNFVPVVEKEGVFIIGILLDITQRKMLEERQKKLKKELQRIQKIDAMSVMASGIAHDFNNLLTVIGGNVEMSRFIVKDGEVSGLLDEAGKAFNLAVQLIRQFTTFSDNYLPQCEKVNVQELLSETLENELKDTGIFFDIKNKSCQPFIKLDGSLIHQVFTNLIKNAIEAMDIGGTIHAELDMVDGEIEAEHTGQPLPPGEYLRVIVTDEGHGIDPDTIDQVFDPYFSTKQKGAQKGMGLGLTIVHSIIKKHRGMVWLDSAPGKGCSVYLYLPVSNIAPGALNGTDSGVANPRVLLMDADEMMRIIHKKMFELCQCEVTLASSGEEAVRLFCNAFEEHNGFDLVLLDLAVEDGMGGVEAAQKMFALDKTAQIIVISGDAANEVMVNYQENNFIAALTKPFSIDTVENVVKQYLC